MAVERDDWRGLLGSRSDPEEVVVIKEPIEQSRRGGAGSFAAFDSEGRKWWVKPANNRQDRPNGTTQEGKVIVTEYLVGSLGPLIGAPTCEVAIVRIPEDIANFDFVEGRKVEPGLAHASADVGNAKEDRSLQHRQRNDNRRRHTGFSPCMIGAGVRTLSGFIARQTSRKFTVTTTGCTFLPSKLPIGPSLS